MTDRSIVQSVVWILGLVTLVSLGIGGYLAIDGKPIPDFIIGMGTGAMGAVAGLLARTSSSPPNEPEEPIGG